MPAQLLPRHRLNGLTSLRFFAALGVLLTHTFGPDGVPGIDLGYLGVTFFFVLSGFVLTWSTSESVGFLSFYRNRAARILPLHYLTLVLAALLPYAMHDNILTFIQGLTVTQAWTPSGAHSFNWVSWSISCEAFFYLTFPAVVVMVRRSPTWFIPVAAVMIACGQAAANLGLRHFMGAQSYFFTYDFPLYRIGEFFLGICLAEMMRRQVRISRPILSAGVVVSIGGLICIVLKDVDQGWGRGQASLAFLPATIALIFVVSRRDQTSPDWWLSSSPLVKLGEWSFALYLVHSLVLRLFARILNQPSSGYFPLLPGLVAILLSVGAAGLACELVEKPLERRLRSPRGHSSTIDISEPELAETESSSQTLQVNQTGHM